MQIIFNEAEKAEIERLIVKYSPANHPLVGVALDLLKQDVRDTLVRDFEDMLRDVARAAYIMVLLVDDEPNQNHDQGISGMQDVLNSMTNYQLEYSDKTLSTLAGRGDSKLSEACYALSLDLQAEILAARFPEEEPPDVILEAAS